MKLYSKVGWGIMTAVFIPASIAAFIAGNYAFSNSAAINMALGTTNTKTTGSSTKARYASDYSFLSKESTKYKDAAVLKLFEEDKKSIENAEGEGAVLLWNKDQALPLAGNQKITLLNRASADVVECGSGSGYVAPESQKGAVTSVTLKEALEDRGYSVNPTMWNFYTTGAGSTYIRTSPKTQCTEWRRWATYEVPETVWNISDNTSTFTTYGDVAIAVISRAGGEYSDLHYNYSGEEDFKGGNTSGSFSAAVGAFNSSGKQSNKTITAENTNPEGGYLGITNEEKAVLNYIANNTGTSKTFKKSVLLLNTPNPVMFKHLKDYYSGISAALWIGQPGTSGLNAIADILKGTINPSGRLPDTFMYNLNSAPASLNDGNYRYANYEKVKCANGDPNYPYQSGESTSKVYQNRYNTYMVYQEGIYVGYRYYETRYEDSILNQGNATGTAGAKESTNWSYDSEVAFPFGYGDSYTKFEYSNFSISENPLNPKQYIANVTVRNTGSVAGKEVVQIYLQKPYTTYDRTNLVEKPAIQLCAYDKTDLLAAGESQTLSIPVSKEELKTYDANNKKTYILEGGDYYFAIGRDAHDALNHVISTKDTSKTSLTQTYFGGYTKTNNATIAAGSVGAVKVTINCSTYGDNVDDVLYSKSTQTGYTITNQLDDGDWNKYENKTGSITYLSRSDWQGTYPAESRNYDTTGKDTGGIENPRNLSISDEMANDLKPNQVPSNGTENNDGALWPLSNSKVKSVPNYGEYKSGGSEPNVDSGDLVALSLEKAPLYPELYTDEELQEMMDDDTMTVEKCRNLWNQLMDQTTFEEQGQVCANAYHQLEGMESINLPGSKQENGPVGITSRSESKFSIPNKNIENYYFVCYPCASIIAASFNDEVGEDVGKHKSEDMFYLGYNGIYGPGVNMHRSPYSGRAYEYPSEDPFLAGCAEYVESKGIENKGCIAFAKHFAINDSETNRRHVGIWSTEQATREIYLRAFELCFTGPTYDQHDGASGAMNSFSRVGTKWNGACYGMQTEILRNEWGWDGVNITDWMTYAAMSPVDAITAGTNSFDGNGSWTDYSAYTSNPIVTSNLRESARVITYNVIHTNACNTMDVNSTVVKFLTWWEGAIYAMEYGFVTIAVASTVMLGLSIGFGIAFKRSGDTHLVKKDDEIGGK